MLPRPTPSRPRRTVLACALFAGGICAPLGALAGPDLGGLIEAALAPYLLGGVSGLAAGLVFRRLLRPPQTRSATRPAAEPLWRDFIEISGDWLWETDSELRFVAIPDAPPAPSIAPQDVIGRHWKDVVLPDLPADFAVALEETMARHGPLAATLPRRTPGGETRHLELKGRPMFDAEGHFSGYRGIGREVTERARLAADLERSEERIVALIAYGHDGYWEQDADLRYTTLTASSGHLADLAAEDAIGSRRWELPGVSPTAAPWAAHIERLRQIEPFSDFLFCRPGPQGRPVWLKESGIPVFDRRGVFAGYCGTTRNVTEEIESRRQLSRDEALFRSLFADAPVGIGRISADGYLVQANPALAAMLGRPATELIMQPVATALAEEDAAASQALRKRCLAGEMAEFTRETPFRHADGHQGWCLDTLRRIDDPEGGPPSLLLARQDITALRAALADREATGKRHQALFEHSPEATLVVVGGQIRLVNAACRQLFGGDRPAELEGVELLSLIHPDDRAMEAARLADFDAAPRQQRLAPLPLRYRRLDGETINAEATGVRLDFEGRPAMLYVLRDVARWLLAEQVLRESQAMYRDVVESVNEILFQTDAEGRLTFLNRAWRNTTGFDTRLSIGQNLLDFVAEDDRGRVGHCLGAIREGYEEIGQFEFRLRTQASGPRWVEAT
ncbi:MAG: PAS domain S-box protein, partial [Zoogloea sp.]|nr:PAS domain S-box protein [Zoogloea sp.]